MKTQRVSKDLVDKVKSTINLKNYFDSLGLHPIPGHTDRYPCAWRPGADSTGFQVKSQGWIDHVANESGDIIEFVKRHQDCDFKTAVLQLADFAGIVERKDKTEITYTYYDYCDEEGKLAFQVVRKEPGRDGKKKEFFQRRPDGSGKWINSLKGLNNKPLYRYPEWKGVFEETLYIVEGEKDVDNLRALGFKATCAAGGAGKWFPSYNEMLKDYNVAIIPDNDGPGKRHSEKVAGQLEGYAASIKILELQGLPEKGDVSDWIEIQRQKEMNNEQIAKELKKLTDNSPVLTPKELAEIKESVKTHSAQGNRENAQAKKSRSVSNSDEITAKEIADEFNLDKSATRSHYRYYREQWSLFDGKIYIPVMLSDLRGDVMAFLQVKHSDKATLSARNNVIANLESTSIAGVPSYYPCPCWLPNGSSAQGWIVMDNIILNIDMLVRKIGGQSVNQQDIVREHSPDLFSIRKINYQYDPGAKCPKFMKFICEVQPNNLGREVLQMLFGLGLLPDTSFEVIFIFHGDGGTGKTTTLKILEALVGEDNVCCLPLNKFSEKHSMHLLTENLLNIVGDLPGILEQGSLSKVEGILKDAASGGIISVERKHKDPVKAPVTARSVFATNTLPRLSDRSNGIWDRLRIIPFCQCFRGTDKQTPNLYKEIIAEELPGIFNWAIEGLVKLRKHKAFPEHPDGRFIAEEHRLACDHEQQFLNENYEEREGAYIQTQKVYDQYRSFCGNNGFRHKNASNFAVDVVRIFKTVCKERKRTPEGRFHVWKNLREMP